MSCIIIICVQARHTFAANPLSTSTSFSVLSRLTIIPSTLYLLIYCYHYPLPRLYLLSSPCHRFEIVSVPAHDVEVASTLGCGSICLRCLRFAYLPVRTLRQRDCPRLDHVDLVTMGGQLHAPKSFKRLPASLLLPSTFLPLFHQLSTFDFSSFPSTILIHHQQNQTLPIITHLYSSLGRPLQSH